MTAPCAVAGCEKLTRPARKDPLCTMHRSRVARHGTTDDPTPTYAQRLMGKVSQANGCWPWLGSIKANGYGQVRNDLGQMKSAHRAVYEFLVGPVDPSLHLDHLCRNRGCVNPAHLEPVTPGENSRRGEPANRTHCPQGHEYTDENTRIRDNKRHCLACHRVHQANYLARRAVA